MNKKSRHFAIRQLVVHRHIASQDELRRLLGSEGFDVTQVTLSRDLRELGVVRSHTADGPRYTIAAENEESRLARLISYEIESIDANEFLIVVRTLPGRAAGVADIIDRFSLDGILGTVAGDNTIFVAPKSTRKLGILLEELKRIVVGSDGDRE